MMFRLLVFVIALALLPTGLLAGPRTSAFHPSAQPSGQTVATVPGATGATAVAGKRCLRGAVPSLSCGADIGLPVTVVLATATAVTDGFERASPTMAGISPGCLVGPPRSC